MSVLRLATGWTVRDSNYGRENIFSRLQKSPDHIWDTHSLIFNVYWGSFPGVIRPGREADHVPPSGAEFKNEVAIHLLPHIWLRGEVRN